ncbi:MAG: RDD family protein [Actinobacteria bacterium]|nr:RDD family protein [Actinomycetota bacterium]
MTTEGNIVSHSEGTIVPEATLPPIASFWHRLGAWVIDAIFLGIIGQILGWSLSFIWFQIGPYGRFVGLFFLIPYFGILNSNIAGGQTIGKRLLKIGVRDGANQPIGIGRSLLRTSILILPFMLNGWSLPILQNPALQWLQAVIVFGGGSILVYTMIFNRGARQGLHDLVCGTYVIHLPGKPNFSFLKTSQIHMVVSGVLLSIAIVATSASAFVGAKIVEKTGLAPIHNLYQVLQQDDRFFAVSVNDNRMYYSQGSVTRTLAIELWYKGTSSSDNERQEIFRSVVQKVFANMDDVNKYDGISVRLTRAYDIGIASGRLFFSETKSVPDWQDSVK